MTPATYNFEPQYRGTYFEGAQLELTETEDVGGTPTTTPLDLTGAIIKIDFKRTDQSTDHKKSITNGNGITVVDALLGIIYIDGFTVDLPAFKYLYDIKITFPGDIPRVYVRGFFPVDQNVTD